MKKFLLLSVALLLLPANSASAEEMTLNDLPKVLNALRECGTFGCKKNADRVWAAVQAEDIVIFYGGSSDNITGRGKTVQDALASLVKNMQQRSVDYNSATKSLAPFLPGQ